jgi:transcriptional regulator with XRE-family HTH domain
LTELIGANLAALLKERGMSQKELAEAAGLTPASVSRYVNGEREPWPATIAALSLALGVEPSDILGTSCGRELDEAVRLVARNADCDKGTVPLSHNTPLPSHFCCMIERPSRAGYSILSHI